VHIYTYEDIAWLLVVARRPYSGYEVITGCGANNKVIGADGKPICNWFFLIAKTSIGKKIEHSCKFMVVLRTNLQAKMPRIL
jgi:hypothetical protein